MESDLDKKEKVVIDETSTLTDSNVGMISSSVPEESDAATKVEDRENEDDPDDSRRHKKHKKKVKINLKISPRFMLFFPLIKFILMGNLHLIFLMIFLCL